MPIGQSAGVVAGANQRCQPPPREGLPEHACANEKWRLTLLYGGNGNAFSDSRVTQQPRSGQRHSLDDFRRRVTSTNSQLVINRPQTMLDDARQDDLHVLRQDVITT